MLHLKIINCLGFCIEQEWMAYYHPCKGFRPDWSEDVGPESD
jgi:hypothetical protein